MLRVTEKEVARQIENESAVALFPSDLNSKENTEQNFKKIMLAWVDFQGKISVFICKNKLLFDLS